MELLIKAAAIGITGALLALLIKKSNPELGLALALAVCVPVCAAAFLLIREAVDLAESAAKAAGVSPAVLLPMTKCVGLGIVTKLSSDLCRDASQAAIASAVELMGAAAALVVALPLLKTLLEMLEGLM